MIPRALKHAEGNPATVLTHIKIQCYSWVKNWTNASVQEINRGPQHLFFSFQTKTTLFLSDPNRLWESVFSGRFMFPWASEKESRVQPSNRLRPVSLWQLTTLLQAHQGQLETKARSQELRMQPRALQAGEEAQQWGPYQAEMGVGRGAEEDRLEDKSGSLNSCRSLRSPWTFQELTVHEQ